MGNCFSCWNEPVNLVDERFHYPIITLDGHMSYLEPVRIMPQIHYQSIKPESFSRTFTL